ncbi:glycine oxidase ThiO [Gloeobacter violaceus]|nr:glycine oxidase ThiO [Gloeobacter violaceus]
MKICILGGGLIGLAVALELRLAGVEVVVLDRGSVPAGWAAAGMIAPAAEGLAGGPLADLAFASRALWPAWAVRLEEFSGQGIDYTPCGALVPAVGDAIAPAEGQWWDSARMASAVPGLAPEIAGGWWLEKEACVDNRKVLTALRLAVERLGAEIWAGVTVTGPADPGLAAVATSAGPVAADAFVLAQGAWSGAWGLPVQPLKGQMLALESEPGWLGAIVFGEDIYLVPRRDGRIVLGATQETIGFTPGNTAGGMASLLAAALTLVPGLASHCILEQWWGFRPVSPDAAPLIGPGPWPNLYLATGHHRNGVLLAPVTAQLVTRALTGDEDPLLSAFSYRRFGGDPR